MTGNEIIGFILPQADDPIQISFLSIIALMMFGTIFSAWRSANEKSWEKKWNRGTPDDASDDLDIEHGSVTDLWHAVATAPEKVAEIMPGMLLVIGLLGTFLGLGLALNKASSILGQANAMSAGAAADSMSHLMGLLQGLGTKFKTSTWGITGFVLLKIWSEAMRYDEKRLAWVIGKVKTELEKRKKETQVAELRKRDELHAQIAATADKVVAGLATQFGTLFTLEKKMHQQSMERMDAQRDGLTELKAEMSATKEAMLTFAQSTQGVVEQMADAAQQMANGAGEIGEAAERMAQGADQVGVAGKDLVGAIDEFKSQFTSVLDDVRKDLGKSIQDMSAQAASTLEKGSAQLSSATHEISTALGVLSEDVNKTMTAVKDSIGQALDIQQRSANEFTLATGNLNESMTATTNIVGELANPIKDGLRSVSDAGQHMRSVGKSLDKSLQAMQDVVTKLELLPGALEPVSELLGHQRKMILMLKPLGDINAGQEQILKEVQGLRTDLRVSTAKPKPHAEQPVAMK